jgi:hypothetical protein
MASHGGNREGSGRPATPAIYILPKSVYTDSLALTNYALGDTHPFF